MSVPHGSGDEPYAGTDMEVGEHAGAVTAVPEADGQPADSANGASTARRYELLGAPACARELPISTVVRELTFGRFIALADTAQPPNTALRVGPRALTMPLSLINTTIAAAATGAEPADVVAFAQAATAAPTVSKAQPAADDGAAPAGNGAKPIEPAPHPVEVKLESVAELLATRNVRLDRADPDGYGTQEVLLPAEVIVQLLTDGKATTLLRDDLRPVLLDATDAPDGPQTTIPVQHEIPDVVAFLSRPQVFTAAGRAVDVALDAEHVTDLLEKRAVTVAVEGQELVLEPRSGARRPALAAEPVATSYAARAPQPAGSDLWGARVSRPLTGLTEAPAREPASPSIGVVEDPALVPVTVTFPPPEETPAPPEVGFYVPYRQQWTLLGYSRGALLNTIALAPQEETTIELFTWDRQTNALEQTSASEVEQNIESNELTKDTAQVVNELGHDSNFKADANFNVSAKLEVVTVGGGASAGGGTSAKDVAKSTTDYIHEQTYKAALRVKASRQSKVSESHEFGAEERTTRKVKNINMCHALNLDYFEVLASYDMQTVCLRQDAQLVVLLPRPVAETYDWYSRETIRRFEPVLRNVLLDRAFVAGFEASRLLAARECAFAAVCERSVCDGDRTDGDVAEGDELDDVKAAALAVFGTYRPLLQFQASIWPTYAFYAAAPPTPDDQLPDAANMFGQWLHLWLFVRQMRNKAPGVWSGLLSVSGSFPTDAAQITPRMLKTLHLILTPKGPAADLSGLLTMDQQSLQAIKGALRQVALQIYKDIPNAKAVQDLADFVKATVPFFDPLGALIKVVTDLVAQGAQKGLVELAAEVGIAAVDARFGTGDLDDRGLVSGIAVFNDAYDTWQKANADLLRRAGDTADALDTLANQRDDQIRSAFPLGAVAEACEREKALMMHLADNDSYYAFAVYQSRLGSESAELPVLVSHSDGLIAPNAIGIVNGKLAFPVNFDAVGTNPAATTALEAWFDTELRQNTALDAGPAPKVVDLPTPGVTLEARLGKCTGCDGFIRESRATDLRHKRALAEQDEHEAKRRGDRLNLPTPNLHDPVHHDPVLAVRVIQDPAPAAPPAPAQPEAQRATTPPTRKP